MCRELLAARGIFRACESGFGMQAPYVTRLIRNTGEIFLNLSGSFLDVCGAAVVSGCYTTPPHPPTPAPPRFSRPRAPAARADGAAGERGRRQGAGSRLRRAWGGGNFGTHKLCNARLSFLYGCEKEGGGGAGKTGRLWWLGCFLRRPELFRLWYC